MRRTAIFLVPILLLALAGGCTDDDRAADGQADGETGAAESARPDAGLLEPQRQALERARGVEEDVAEAAAR